VSEMVERGALAAKEARDAANSDPSVSWQDMDERIARAVIKAIRLDNALQSESCSSDIVDAGRNAWMEWEVGPDDFKRANAATVDCWNAMIDAALNPDRTL
jgi:hypothetical protein